MPLGEERLAQFNAKNSQMSAWVSMLPEFSPEAHIRGLNFCADLTTAGFARVPISCAAVVSANADVLFGIEKPSVVRAAAWIMVYLVE